MVENGSPSWLVLDGYEDEPAAFGVPPYVGFHIRYVCGVLEQHKIDYTYLTIDQWRLFSEEEQANHLRDLEGFVCIAGAVVPGRYIRGTPISRKESTELISYLPRNIPALFGGWAVRGWKQQGWLPLRSNLFLAVQDTDATLNGFLKQVLGNTNVERARNGHPGHNMERKAKLFSNIHLGTEEERGPLTYEVEVYQGCVRFKRRCKFCIEPKKVYRFGVHQKTSSKRSNLHMMLAFNTFDSVE